MVINLEIEFHENEIPPRCRKPRQVRHQDTVSVKIRETTFEAAPIAFIVHSLRGRPVNVRLYKGQLYKEARISFYNGKESEEYPFESIPWHTVFCNYTPSNAYTTRAEYIAYLKVESREYLIVDRALYVRCYEPYYKITTFGLFGDGTAIFPEFSLKSRKIVFGYSALDKDQAIEDAVAIAKERGDDGSIDGIKNLAQGPIDVLIPEACKRKFNPQI